MVACRFYNVMNLAFTNGAASFWLDGGKKLPDLGSWIQLGVCCKPFVYYPGSIVYMGFFFPLI